MSTYYELTIQFSSIAVLLTFVLVTMLVAFSGDVCGNGCEVNVTSPWEVKTLIPEGSSVVWVNYTAKSNHESCSWSIRLPDRQRNDDFTGVVETMILNNRSFYELRPVNETIRLVINNTVGINGTVLMCENIMSGSTLQSTTLLVYEPTKLQINRVKDVDSYSVNLTWNSLEIHEQINKGINPIYSLTVVTHNCTIPSQSFWSQESFYIFTASEHGFPCEVYNFSVTTAYNGATYTGDGCSEPSPVISRMLPSLPDIEPLNSSLTYSLAKVDSKVTLNASFESAMFCEDYPVLNYTLEVNSSSGIVTHSIVQGNSIVFGDLSENREYSFRVLAANAVGIVSSSDRQFYTTDVQDVTAVLSNYSEDNNTVMVECDFIPGSDAKGCMVVIVGNGENATINLTRNVLYATGIINVTFRWAKFCSELEVVGYDIELDGSVGTLGIVGKHMLSNESMLCMEKKDDEMELSASIELKVWIIVSTAVAAVIIISLTTVVFFGGVIAFFKRSKVREFTTSAQSNCQNSFKVHTLSAQVDQDGLESNEVQQNLDERIVEDVCHEHAQSNYAEVKDKEHIYHVLENNALKNNKGSSPPPIYQDVFDFPSTTKGPNSTTENQYTSLQ